MSFETQLFLFGLLIVSFLWQMRHRLLLLGLAFTIVLTAGLGGLTQIVQQEGIQTAFSEGLTPEQNNENLNTFVHIGSQPVEMLIDDFEQYTDNQQLGGQGAWLASGNSCDVLVMKADSSWEGQIARSDDCVNAQRALRSYSFVWGPAMDATKISFSGRITDGSGNNSSSILFLRSELKTISFGLSNNPSLGIDHQTRVTVSGTDARYGANLQPGVWYDFQLVLDLRYVSSEGGYGLADFAYRQTGEMDWVSEDGLSGVELNLLAPSSIQTIGMRLDGIGSRRGEIDNIKYTYTPTHYLIFPLVFGANIE